MNRIKKIIVSFCENNSLFSHLLNWYRLQRLKTIIKVDPRQLANNVYRQVFHKNINWENPSNLIEKIYWLQLFSDTSLWTICADKYRVREYLQSRNLEHLLPQLYGCWSDSKDIDFSKLPNQFVIKTTNGCGQVLVVKDKKELNIKDVRTLLNNWMKLKYGFDDAQIHYSKIIPSIIAEQYLVNVADESKNIVDYKIWCLNGQVEYVLCVYDRVILGENKGYRLAAFDKDWNDISAKCLKQKYCGDEKIPKPFHFNEMIETAELIANDFLQVRVDFYDTIQRLYLGELTFTTGYGYHTDDFYEYLGSKLDLSMASRVCTMNRIDESFLYL